MTGELSLIAKATVILAAALIGVRALRGTRASVRALLLAASFAVLLMLPAASLLISERSIEVPIPYAEAFPLVLEQVDAAVPVAPMSTATQESDRSTWRLPPAATLMRGFWALAALVLLIRLGAALRRVRAMRRHGLPWLDGAALVGTLARSADLRRDVDVFLHEHLSAPMTFGLRRPAIGLPLDAPACDAADLRNALVHELEHVRRGDWVIHLMARAVCALYWFHPLAWIAARQLCLEAERACDDAVLREAERTAYAEQLVSLARHVSRRDPVAVLSMAARSDLSTRVRAVLDGRQPRGPAGTFLTVAVVSASVVLVLTISPLQAVTRLQEAPSAAPAGGGPTFDVASVKPNVSGETRVRFETPPGRLIAVNAPLRFLIRQAYRVPESRIIGGPSWIDADRFDIAAAAEEGAPRDRVRLMLRELLRERFRLALTSESREMPVYVLRVARNDGRLGPHLRRSIAECTGRPSSAAAGRVQCGILVSQNAASASLRGGAATMDDFVRLLGDFLDRPLIDRTGLTGAFDLELQFAAERSSVPGAPVPGGLPAAANVDDVPLVSTALQEQLGLTLEAQRAPVDVLVIDRVERPTPNDAPALQAPPQATQPAPAFDVVSIRQNTSTTGAPTTRVEAGRYVASNVALQLIINDAYRMPIAGGPEWIRNIPGPQRTGTRFDIVATIPPGTPPAQVPLMLRAMLADRFKLAVHTETQERDAYALVHARDDKRLGSQLTRSTQQCQAEIEAGPLRAPVRRVTDDGKPLCSMMVGPATIRGGGLTLRFLANALGGFAGRMVVDRTGLEEPFDFEVRYAPAARGGGSASLGAGGPPPPEETRPSIFVAVQEQLGLKLEPTTAAVEVLVIDRVEMPTED